MSTASVQTKPMLAYRSEQPADRLARLRTVSSVAYSSTHNSQPVRLIAHGSSGWLADLTDRLASKLPGTAALTQLSVPGACSSGPVLASWISSSADRALYKWGGC